MDDSHDRPKGKKALNKNQARTLHISKGTESKKVKKKNVERYFEYKWRYIN